MYLLEAGLKKALEDAQARGQIVAVEQQADLLAALPGAPPVTGGRAVIPVEGILTEKRDFLAMIFGGGNTIYGDISAAIAEANANNEVSEIVLEMNASPGGTITGLFAAMESIRSSEKPVRAFVHNVAASAAYLLISQAGEIIAANPATRIGSNGVVAATKIDPNVVETTNTDSPDKRPDPQKVEGVATIRAHLDSVFGVFTEPVASARGVTVETVREGFGRGAMFTAAEAVERKMIDRIGTLGEIKTTASGGNMEEAMDLKKLKADHPDVYAAAVQEGVAIERDRVIGHLTLGDVGDPKAAREAVAAGTGITPGVQATHVAAGMNRTALAARVQDNPDTLEGGDDNDDGAPDAEAAMAETVAAAVEGAFGMEVHSG